METVKQPKELDELAGTAGDGEDGIDESSLTLALITLYVNYYYSTIT